MSKSKIYDCIMGVAVGDAFGFPYQFLPRDTYKVSPNMKALSKEFPAGSWSDDTAMTLATMESLSIMGRVDISDIMLNFSLWFSEGMFTPFGFAYDIGRGTAMSIRNYIRGADVTECGLRGKEDNGNGSLMRILPLAFSNATLDDIAAVSSLTHGHELAIHACQIQVAVARKLLKGFEISEALRSVMAEYPYCTYEEYSNLATIGSRTRDEIRSTGFVKDTIEAAMWCLLNSSSYRECILLAARLGWDTDSVGAVAGGLAGIIYGSTGLKGIPPKWIKALQAREFVEELITQFEENCDFGNILQK